MIQKPVKYIHTAIGAAMAAFVAVSSSAPATAATPQTTAEADSVEMMSAAEAAAPLPVTQSERPSATKEADTTLTAADLFVSAPASVFPTIDQMTRMDMIDYFKAGSEKPSKNLIGGECRITEEAPDKLVFTTSRVSEYTLAVLPASAKSGKIIMLARTLKTPAEDSTVAFYDTSWNELKGLFTVPSLEDWMLHEGKKNRKDVENAVPFVLARLEYFPESKTVTFTNNLPDYIPEESLGIATSAIRKTITFRWDGKRLVMEK